jgi:hypothetical protein
MNAARRGSQSSWPDLEQYDPRACRVPWHSADNPDDATAQQVAGYREARLASRHLPDQFFDAIPADTDILLTHGPPRGIFDRMELSDVCWGSSQLLRQRIEQVRPKVHMFGHLHEQRGVWHRRRDGDGFEGGVEYQRVEGEKWYTFAAPSPEYPCLLISCNAMKNHPGMEGTKTHRIAGPARLIIASQREGSGAWKFLLAQ